MRLYGLRNWIEQSYKQMKDELGWADFMVRSDRAIRRHWTLVCYAFAFCWWYGACQARARRGKKTSRVKALPSLRSPVSSMISTPSGDEAVAGSAANSARSLGGRRDFPDAK